MERGDAQRRCCRDVVGIVVDEKRFVGRDAGLSQHFGEDFRVGLGQLHLVR